MQLKATHARHAQGGYVRALGVEEFLDVLLAKEGGVVREDE
jgi:hypothetical protein